MMLLFHSATPALSEHAEGAHFGIIDTERSFGFSFVNNADTLLMGF